MFPKLLVRVIVVATLSVGLALGPLEVSDTGRAFAATSYSISGPTCCIAPGSGTWTYEGTGVVATSFGIHFVNTSNGVDYVWYHDYCGGPCAANLSYSHSFATAGVRWYTYICDSAGFCSGHYNFTT